MRSKVREAYLLNFKFANTQNLLAFLDSIYPTLLNLILFFFLEPGQSPAHSPRSPPPQGRQSPEAAQSPQGRQSQQARQSPANQRPARGPQQAQVAQFPPRQPRPRQDRFRLPRETLNLQRARDNSKFLTEAKSYIENVKGQGLKRGKDSRTYRLFYFSLLLHALLELLQLIFWCKAKFYEYLSDVNLYLYIGMGLRYI